MHVIDQTQTNRIELKNGKLKAEFLPTGDLYRLGTDDVMINQVLTNPIDGSLSNIFLRIHKIDEILFIPLLGIKSNSEFFVGERQVKWTGKFENISYSVIFDLKDENSWNWHINLNGNEEKVDLIYGQDLGLASQETVQTNEAYIAQYVDHNIFEGVICSRQNMEQENGNHPYVEQGASMKISSFSTDGYQFFGTSYKETNVPKVLREKTLPSEILQYEFSYIALQVTPFYLNGEKEITFYGYMEDNHSRAVTESKISKRNLSLKEEKKLKKLPKLIYSSQIGSPLKTNSLMNVKERYPNRIQEENEKEKWYSFYTDKFVHVVSKEKELAVERPHGHILLTGGHKTVNEDIMTTTSWMFGVFNAQTLVGNTDMNKWITNTRNSLNILKTSGQRIYVKLDGQYRLLTMPSAFEMGFNYSRWIYQTDDETFVVTVFSTYGQSEIRLQLEAESGRDYKFLVTNQVIMNQKEYVTPIIMEENNQALTFFASKQALNFDRYPNLRYRLLVDGTKFTLHNESFFVKHAEAGCASLVVLELSETDSFEIRILEGETQPSVTTFEEETEKFNSYLQNLMNNFDIKVPGNLPTELEKLNIISRWYTHNMLVHYLVPHGLEQYGGAAWGTRDVSQGPAEFFLATQHYGIVKEIIKTIFSHQFEENGNWPQWFMFDKYKDIYAHESHGDIIVWPLKLVADYLKRSGDHSILEEKVPYMSMETGEFTKEFFTLRDHLSKEIGYIRNNFLWDTYLSSYGDGDWDDTLQPNNQSLKENMASSWTVALTYEALVTFSESLVDFDKEFSIELSDLAVKIRNDYNKYILSDEVIPGFVYMPKADNVEFIIHPSDTKTGIKYRLLPMIQGITSEIFTKEQSDVHYDLIKEYLAHPDGIRLMSRPASYNGGVSTHFKRAEQAAYFGREVGLLYVHAHIRFIESMAKIGKTEDVWRGLEVINPVNIQQVVPNASKRQSNAYFSSSDGAFNTRYDAAENFGKLKTGTVSVKGGWRIYSSGPGIYLNQLISNVLGISTRNQDLILDPILPETYNGLMVTFAYLNKPVTFKFTLANEVNSVIIVNGEKIKGIEIYNPYRPSGIIVSRNDIEPFLTDTENIIEFYYQTYGIEQKGI